MSELGLFLLGFGVGVLCAGATFFLVVLREMR